MSDNKNKAAKTATPPKPSVTKLGKALKELLCCATHLEKDFGALPDYEQLVKDNEQLELAVKKHNADAVKREAEISSLKAEKSRLFDHFEERGMVHQRAKKDADVFRDQAEKFDRMYRSTLEELKAARKENEDLKREMERQMKDVRRENESLKESNRNYEMRMLEQQAELKRYEICKNQLSKLEKDVGKDLLIDFEDEKLIKLRKDLEELWFKGHSLAVEFFNNSKFTMTQTSSAGLLERYKSIPLPTTASPQAAQMRYALSLAIIANILQSQVLIPFFLPEKLRTAAARVLDELLDKDETNDRALLHRGLMLTLARELGAGAEIAKAAVDVVYKQVIEMLPQDCWLDVKTRLRETFELAVKIWSEVQLAVGYISCEIPADDDDHDEVPVPRTLSEFEVEPASGSPKTQPQQDSKIIAVLFPRVMTDTQIIHPGIVLRSGQASVVAAKEELTPSRMNGYGKARQSTILKRRQSIATAQGSAPPK